MTGSKSNYPYVVADVGGTNSRFALVTAKDSKTGEFLIERQETYASADFESIEEAFLRYRDSLNGISIENACLAVAGPVTGDNIKLTNLNWNFNVPKVKSALGLSNLLIINDFAAYAFAIQYLDASCFKTIKAGTGIKESPIAVLGPGTGFGTASLVSKNGHMNVHALEGGHMSLATNNALQSAIKENLSHKFNYVSIESVFSGSGLRYMYQAFNAVEGVEARKLSTAEISQCALDGSDQMCVRTLSLFCSWLGAVVGDFVLTLGATGGVYLCGGILPRIDKFLINSDFTSSFMAKTHMKFYLENIPVQLVVKGNSALLGCAGWYENNA